MVPPFPRNPCRLEPRFFNETRHLFPRGHDINRCGHALFHPERELRLVLLQTQPLGTDPTRPGQLRRYFAESIVRRPVESIVKRPLALYRHIDKVNQILPISRDQSLDLHPVIHRGQRRFSVEVLPELHSALQSKGKSVFLHPWLADRSLSGTMPRYKSLHSLYCSRCGVR